jgi:arylsulfatase A
VSDALVSQIDLMATFADILDRELAAGQAEDAYSFLPALKQQAAVGRTTLIHNTKADHYAIRDGKWVLINGETGNVRNRPPLGEWESANDYGGDGFPVELYDLSADLPQRNHQRQF